LQSKTPFSFAIVAGDLFADPSIESEENEESLKSLLNGQVDIPLPVYFGIGKHALPSSVIDRLESRDGEVCSNLYFLGKRSTTKTSEGIRVVSLGGALDATIAAGQSKEKYLPFHTEGDAKALHGANSAEILITSNWPSSIQTGSKVQGPRDPIPIEEQCIAELCSRLKPRYHFSTSAETFYEREPFYHRPSETSPEERPLTRFISLASLSNTTKAKWLYAFSIDPKSSHPTSVPSGTTPCPFNIANKRSAIVAPDEMQSYSRYSNGGKPNHSHRSSKRRRNQPPPGPDECFFCLSNPNLSTHLITSIGSDAYLTTAKGPLTLKSTYPSLETPCHILIIPLAHAPTLSSIQEQESQKSTFQELQRYKNALNSMLHSKVGGKLGSVTWEVSRNRGVHFHWQFLPVPLDTIKKGLVEAAFKVEAENEQYPSVSKRDIGDGMGEGEYFRVWVWQPDEDMDQMEEIENGKEDGHASKGSEFQLILPLVPEIRFDIQFGRRVMGKLLGLEKRLDWKDCIQEEEEEIEEAERFKALFKQFDFSLED
jgi:hypothetical protein